MTFSWQKNLQNSIFSKAGIQNVNKNKTRNLLVIKLKKHNTKKINSVLETSKLGEFEVE